MSQAWSDCPIVLTCRVVCPFCRGLHSKIVKSIPESDGSVTRRRICSTCSRRFLEVREPPENGDPSYTIIYPATNRRTQP